MEKELKKVFTWYDFAKYLVKGILICVFLLVIMWIMSSCSTPQVVCADNLISERFVVESDTQSGIYNDPDYGLIHFRISSNIDWNQLIENWYNYNLDEYIIINETLIYKNTTYYEYNY